MNKLTQKERKREKEREQERKKEKESVASLLNRCEEHPKSV